MHSRNEDGGAALRRGTAHARSQRDSHTGHLALKGPQHEFAGAQEIKSRPVQIGQTPIERCCRVGGVGERVPLIGE
jgi:hypothetical protein